MITEMEAEFITLVENVGFCQILAPRSYPSCTEKGRHHLCGISFDVTAIACRHLEVCS